jgi:hypothetical protein
MDEKKPEFGPGMEGEGNKTADREYRKGVREHLDSGRVEIEAKDAERDIEQSPEEYERAVEEGKRHSAGDLERDLHGKAKPEKKPQ